MIHDFIVIGGGISGAAAAYRLAELGSVLVLEAEGSLGYHSTGRSAALFTRNYGGPVVRQITAMSAPFFATPPGDFCDAPLLTPRGSLTVAEDEAQDQLTPLLRLSEPGEEVVAISPAEALDLAPYLRPERVAAAVYEANVTDIDVASLHQGYIRGIRRRGGTVAVGQAVTGLSREAGGWAVKTPNDIHRAKLVVNAAGAWADHIGALAGAFSIGLVPKRRTNMMVDAPEGLNLAASPAVDFAGSGAYMKPDSGRLMASLGDATPTEAQDVQPEELDIALLAHRIETETVIRVRRVSHAWAGLRSFVADEAPVVGFDARAPDFLWLAAQGGYGIMMAPALSQVVSDLISKQSRATAAGSGFAMELLSSERLTKPS